MITKKELQEKISKLEQESWDIKDAKLYFLGQGSIIILKEWLSNLEEQEKLIENLILNANKRYYASASAYLDKLKSKLFGEEK